MLHRVVIEHSTTVEKNKKLELRAEDLRQLIYDYKAKGYSFVTLEDFLQQESRFTFLPQKLIHLTFDDGYKDVLHVALPILRELNIPFTFFISTDIIEHQSFMWWYILEDYVNSQLGINCNTELSSGDIEMQNKLYNRYHAEISEFDTVESQKWFEERHFLYEEMNQKYNQIYNLTWDELETLSHDPLCTIESHTVTHARLSKLSPEQIRKELQDSKEIPEKRLDIKIQHLSYPYGSCSKLVSEITKKCGYKSGILSYGGAVHKYDNNFWIKRKGVY